MVATGPANGTLTLNADGTFTYTPNADFNGTDQFTYRLTDDDGETSTAVATINVTAVNDTPVANPDTFTTDEDVALNSAVLGNDQLGDQPSIVSLVAGAATTRWTAAAAMIPCAAGSATICCSARTETTCWTAASATIGWRAARATMC